jgi:hypothetical protein
MRDKPNYYAIIPADVRYDTDITPNAKLLYGEITALCNKEGHCWATNNYFADLYGKNKKSISAWIKQLKDKGHIRVEMRYKPGGKEIEARYIHLTTHPQEENKTTPPPEKVTDNTTVNNTTSERETFFLNLFNEEKSKTGRKSNVRVLSRTDKANLKQLAEYTLGDFKKAIRKMLESDWAKRTGNQTPTHILRVDNFNRYLTQAEDDIKNETDEERTIRLLNETTESQ